MMSLVIMGEYDDMKHLVRDGSKKLRDATELPDTTLLGVNKPRDGVAMPQGVGVSSPRKRVSPNYVGGQRASHSRTTGGGLPQSTPPKLRSHPRDRPSSRKHQSDDKSRGRDSSSHAASHQGNGHGTDGDWSNALGLSRGFHSIWNCGGTGEDTGTISPTQVVNQKDGKTHAVDMVSAPYRPVFEGRDSGFAQARESGVTARAI